MNQDEFSERYNADLPMLEAWGKFVKNSLQKGLTEKLGYDGYYQTVKIEPSVRIKTLDSLLNKAFVRKKGKYQDPYNDITDKIGLRFVVLLTKDIEVLQLLVESETAWEYSRDRDFQEEIEKEPMIFNYQSVHYVVRNHAELTVPCTNKKGDVIVVPAQTPCEIQIRTLLQHAYAEVTHDTLYKSHVVADAIVHRTIAKSMALMETTDDLLVKAKGLLGGPEQLLGKWESRLKSDFDHFAKGNEISYSVDEPTIWYVLDALQNMLPASFEDFDSFWADESSAHLKVRIIKHWKHDSIYRQPIILLVYFLADGWRHTLSEQWPYPRSTLESVFSDLGIAPP
ncbi:hypothetical protein [Candidatus Sororendozoicomonas aggregata]|uniref:GTP pyrophosphokinase n=1 Tax=Candidatus Sororendozoicomonas aggregata TaxID=3073239 RepID=UPI002ED3E9DE